MTLTGLDAYFVRYELLDGHVVHRHVDTFAEAQGVSFLCPGCFVKNSGPVGTHSLTCWFAGRGVPDDAEPLPGRWAVTGTALADLTLAPSVDVGDDHCWHGFVQNGQIR